MTDPITPVFIRVIRPLLAAFLGLALFQIFEDRPKNNGSDQPPTIIVHIPAA